MLDWPANVLKSPFILEPPDELARHANVLFFFFSTFSLVQSLSAATTFSSIQLFLRPAHQTLVRGETSRSCPCISLSLNAPPTRLSACTSTLVFSTAVVVKQSLRAVVLSLPNQHNRTLPHNSIARTAPSLVLEILNTLPLDYLPEFWSAGAVCPYLSGSSYFCVLQRWSRLKLPRPREA